MEEVWPIVSPIVAALAAWYVQKARYDLKIKKLKAKHDSEIRRLRSALDLEISKIFTTVEQRIGELVDDFRKEGARIREEYGARLEKMEEERRLLADLLKETFGKEKVVGERLVCICRKAIGPRVISPRGAHRAQCYIIEGYPAIAYVEKGWRG